jgi:penicillin-binding protein 2
LAPVGIKDPSREILLLHNRSLAVLLVCALLIAALIGRLVWLQIYSHEHYQTLSHDNRVSLGPIVPARGLIYDRNGVALALNVPSYSLEVIPEHIEDMGAMLDEIAQVVTLTERDRKRFKRERKRHHSFDSVPLRSRLDEVEVARFSINRHRFPGVEVHARLSRHYPLAELTGQMLGYVGRINEKELKSLNATEYNGSTYIGKVGVENYYEATLHGKVGRRWVERNAQGRILRELKRVPSAPGRNLHLHLDSKLQHAVTRALGNEKGAVVALDPNTGGILAMVSMPYYDPNLFVGGIDNKTYQGLRNNPDRPLINRALRGAYPPGSTVKPFVGLAGLETNVTTPQHDAYCPGWMTLTPNGHRYRCWKHSGHGHMNLKSAITQSCDVYFYDLARILGIDRLHDYMDLFSFGRRTGVDISGERPGLMPSAQWKRKRRKLPWYPGETLITGIGQGFFLATPLQLAHATSVLVNHGEVRLPRAVATVEDPATGTRETQDSLQEDAIPVKQRANWDRILDAMRNVVHGRRGTAKRIGKDLPFEIGGKTGTAQLFSIKQGERYDKKNTPKHLRDHALFIAFAPVDNPAIVVAVIVENGGGGSTVAAPIARKVIDAWLLGEDGDDAKEGDDH